jgi:diguanylate cyclase
VSEDDGAGPFSSFRAAAHATLQLLHEMVPLRLWMVARDTGDYWVALHAVDRSHVVRGEQILPLARSGVVKDGDVIHWSERPPNTPAVTDHIAIDGAENRHWGAAPIVHHLRPAAYIGAPILHTDGRVFGTLCGTDPEPAPAELGSRVDEVVMFSRLLATILAEHMRIEEEERRADQLELDAHRDPLTGLPNRRAWTQTLAREQSRADRHGHPTTIVSIDLDDLKVANDTKGHPAGDALLRSAAEALGLAIRPEDTAARLGGDEFGVICVDCTHTRGGFVAQRLRLHLQEKGVSASLGCATSYPGTTLVETWEQADKVMYADKQRRKGTAAR